MTNFDVPNPEELRPNKVYNYDLIPQQYPIQENRSTNTYDQFIMLRDTLVYSKKYYQGKGGSKLIIGEKEDTVEVEFFNKYLQKMNPNRKTSPSTDMDSRLTGPYVSQEWIDMAVYGILSCKIEKDWMYRVQHKEEIINIPADTMKIYSYVERYPVDQDGNYPTTWTPIAVFDREVPSWADYTLDQLFKKMTAQGYIETNLNRWDILALRIEDQDWNDLPLQGDRSNRWSVEYINLPLKD